MLEISSEWFCHVFKHCISWFPWYLSIPSAIVCGKWQLSDVLGICLGHIFTWAWDYSVIFELFIRPHTNTFRHDILTADCGSVYYLDEEGKGHRVCKICWMKFCLLSVVKLTLKILHEQVFYYCTMKSNSNNFIAPQSYWFIAVSTIFIICRTSQVSGAGRHHQAAWHLYTRHSWGDTFS